MQDFYNKLRKAKDGRTSYQSFLVKVTRAPRAQIKAVPYSNWGH